METTHSSRHPKFVRWALMLGIVVILNVFFSALVSLALPSPNYSAADAATCDTSGGVWTESPTPTAPATVANEPGMPPVAQFNLPGYCDFTALQNQHALYAFVLMIGLGILAFIAGLAPLGSSIVASGLSYGGVLTFIIGSASYWGTAGNWIRLIIAALGLAALLYIGWKRFKD